MFHPADPGDALLRVAATTVSIYLLLLLATRLVGLRSFAKLSSFDFAVTIAIGSLISATIVTRDPLLFEAAVGLIVLYSLQVLVNGLRVRLGLGRGVVDNRPLLLMRKGEVLEKNLKKAGLTQEDLLYKLREANVLRIDEVHAVVMETTGDVSVLHGDPGGVALDPGLLEDVRTDRN